MIFDGSNNLLNTGWNTQTFDVSASLLLEMGNVLTISNTSSRNYDASPAFMVNYVVLRQIN